MWEKVMYGNICVVEFILNNGSEGRILGWVLGCFKEEIVWLVVWEMVCCRFIVLGSLVVNSCGWFCLKVLFLYFFFLCCEFYFLSNC